MDLTGCNADNTFSTSVIFRCVTGSTRLFIEVGDKSLKVSIGIMNLVFASTFLMVGCGENSRVVEGEVKGLEDGSSLS